MVSRRVLLTVSVVVVGLSFLTTTYHGRGAPVLAATPPHQIALTTSSLDRSPAPPFLEQRHAVVSRVETSVQTLALGTGEGRIVRVSAALRRAVVLGTESLAVVDTSRLHVVATITPTASGSSDQLPAISLDESRHRAYIAVSGSLDVEPTLTAVDLVTGKVLYTRSIQGYFDDGVMGLGIDAVRGTVFVVVYDPGISFFGTGKPSTIIVAMNPSGHLLRKTKLPFIADRIIVDGSHRRVLAIGQGDPFTMTGVGLAAFDTVTLAPAWRATAPYVPDSIAYDSRRGWVWLVAQGGRATIVAISHGHTIATIPLKYPKPTSWQQNHDLVIDERTGVGYISWYGGSDIQTLTIAIDRIDPATRKRITLQGGGGVVLGLDPMQGLLITLDAGGTITVRWCVDGKAVKDVGSYSRLVGEGYIDAPQGDVVSSASTSRELVVAIASTIAFQNDITNASTADGLILLKMTITAKT